MARASSSLGEVPTACIFNGSQQPSVSHAALNFPVSSRQNELCRYLKAPSAPPSVAACFVRIIDSAQMVVAFQAHVTVTCATPTSVLSARSSHARIALLSAFVRFFHIYLIILHMFLVFSFFSVIFFLSLSFKNMAEFTLLR